MPGHGAHRFLGRLVEEQVIDLWIIGAGPDVAASDEIDGTTGEGDHAAVPTRAYAVVVAERPIVAGRSLAVGGRVEASHLGNTLERHRRWPLLGVGGATGD